MLEDFHSRTQSTGEASARRHFWGQTLTVVWSLGVSRRRATNSLRTASQEFPMHHLWSDLRSAARMLRTAPLFTLLCALSLGLGIGSAAAMFGIVNRIILHGPELVVEPRNVMRFYATFRHPPNELETGSVTGYVTYSTLRSATHDFAGFGTYQANNWIVGTGSEARSLPGVAASWDFFPTLGVHPYLGRFYSAKEDDPGTPKDVVVLSYEFWISAFGGNRDVLGKTISIAFRPFTVIGVAPRGFSGTDLGAVDYWIPVSAGAHPRPDWPTTWQASWLQVVARLKPGVSADQAARDATTVIRAAYAGPDTSWHHVAMSVRPMSFTSDGTEPAVHGVARWLSGVTIVVLLIACANIGNLLLTRALKRRGEIAVRLALGMSRARLVQWLTAESLVLSSLGGALGVLVAYLAGFAIRRFFLADVVWTAPLVDGRTALAIVVLTAAVTILVSMIPLAQSHRVDFVEAVRTGVRDGGGRHERVRGALIVFETTLTGVLLVVAGLFSRSLINARRVDLGIQTDRVVAAAVYWPLITATDSTSRAAEAQRERATLERIRDSLAHRGDLAGASLVTGSPFRSASSVDLKVPGWDTLPVLGGGGPWISAVGRDYFATVGTRVVRGREFTPTEGRSAVRVAIVNETMARTLWPKGDAIGKCLLIGGLAQCATIVGVTQDVHRFRIREEPAMQYYVPLGQEIGMSGATVVARARGDAARAIDVVRQVVGGLVPGARYVDAALLQDRIDPQIRPWRLGSSMFGVFAALALIVAATGLYSVIAYVVTQRTHEFGIRLALGATGAQIVGLVLAYGMRAVLAGTVVSGMIAAALGSRLAPQLFDVSPRDPVVYGAVALVMIGVAAVALVVPAVRASGTDPAVALRQE
jgi:predicted permease